MTAKPDSPKANEPDTPNAPEQPETPPTDETTATVQKVDAGDMGSWHLVTYNSWQISVAPDSLLHLPRHLHPREVADFIGAITAAADVGTKIAATNEERALGDDRTLAPRRALVAEGPPPAGAVRMPVVPGGGPPVTAHAGPQMARASIGRPKAQASS